jgi:hypothetical protein
LKEAGVFAELDELPHGRLVTLGLGHVRDDPAGHLHRHQRVTIDVSVGGNPEFVETFDVLDYKSLRGAQRRKTKRVQGGSKTRFQDRATLDEHDTLICSG